MTLRPIASLFLVLSWVDAACAGPAFVERARGYGFSHVYSGGWEHFVGGGAAVFDCDGDDFPDAYVAGGADPARLLRNRTSAPGGAILFEAATPPDAALAEVTGAWPLDLDNDGWLDLAVLRVGGNCLLKGGADCSFTDVTEATGFGRGRNGARPSRQPGSPGSSCRRLPSATTSTGASRTDPSAPVT